MRIFKSKTGYIKSLIDNIIYKNDTIYLGIYDNEDNYTEATKEEYEANMKEVEGKIQPIFVKLYQDGAQGGMLNVVVVRGLQHLKVNYPPEDT